MFLFKVFAGYYYVGYYRVLTVSANQKKKIFCRKLNLVERNIECNFSVLRYKRKPNVSGSLNTFENG